MKRRFLLVSALLGSLGCSVSPVLVGHPVEVTHSGAFARFEQAVPASVAQWEICLEFDQPGDSHLAEEIAIALHGTSGKRHPLGDVRLDRRGESVVCQIGHLETLGSERGLEAIDLSSPKRLRIRRIRGEPLP
jgi:hypothetical protein